MLRTLALLCMVALAAGLPAAMSKDLSPKDPPKSWYESFSMTWSKKADETMVHKENLCEESDWRQASMKLLQEIPAAGLFQDLRGTSKWEISGMTVVKKELYMIFDSLDVVGVTDQRIGYMEPEATLIGRQGEEESGFEAIEYAPDTDTFMIIREAIETPLHGSEPSEHYHASILEVKITGSGSSRSYEKVEECYMDYKFLSENKGLEGGAYIAQDGKRYLLGLCEGNFCEGGEKGRETGNGRIILSVLDKSGDECVWKHEKMIKLPKEVDFLDYADMAIYGNKVAIVSQENAAVWIGDLDTEKWKITGPGVTYHFPRDPHCEIIYCNIEGIVFLDQYRLAAASDRSKEDQPYNCVPHDQSVMIFQIPTPLESPTKHHNKKQEI